MPDDIIRCTKCGVILVDKRRKRIRSCAHYPLTIERFDGKEQASIICLGTERSGFSQIATVECHDFNKCFEDAMSWCE